MVGGRFVIVIVLITGKRDLTSARQGILEQEQPGQREMESKNGRERKNSFC
jgi:hypothetical protein